MSVNNLDVFAFDFFREFARYEYCLKAVGLRKTTREAKADWNAYAADVVNVIEDPQSDDLKAAITYFTDHPPKKQVVENGELQWDDKLPDHNSKAELMLLLICRVRNNLFHGGKFNGRWFEPQRSENLMQHALVMLKACADSHEQVSAAYSGNVR